MSWLRGQRKNLCLVLAVGAGFLGWPDALLGAERPDPTEPYKGVREATLRYVAPGTPDDLLRLRDALDKTEQEIARLQLEPERQEQFAQKQKELKDLKDRLSEAEALQRLLSSSKEGLPERELDRLSAEERAALRGELSGRIKALGVAISGLEKAVRFEHAEYLRILVDEKKALERLLAVRREQLLGELTRASECRPSEWPCLRRKLKLLCRLQPLVSEADRLPILVLMREVDSQLKVSNYPPSAICDYDRHDFGM